MKMKRTAMFFIALLVWNTFSVFPSEGLPLQQGGTTLEGAVQKASDDAASLALLEARIKNEEALRSNAIRGYLPKVNSEVEAALVTQKDPAVLFWTNGVSLPLFDGGGRSHLARIHSLRADEGREAFRSARADLAFKVEETYIRVLAEKDMTRLSGNWVKEAKRMDQAIKTLYDKDLATKEELYRAKTLFMEAQYEHVRHKQAMDYGSKVLQEALHLTSAEQLELEPLGRVSRQTFREEDFLENPIFKSSELRIRQSAEEVKTLRAGYFPRIALNSRYKMAKDSFLDQNRFEFGVSGSWNVWDFGQRSAEIRAKRLELHETELSERLKVETFQDNVRHLIFELRSAWHRIMYENANMREKKEAYLSMKTRMIADELGRAQVFNAYAAHMKAQIGLVQAVLDYRILCTKLKYLKEGSLN